MTGMNPGNHGIFSFAMRRRGSYERDIIGPEMLRSKTLWRILSEAGKGVAVINVPMSDMEEVRGFVVRNLLVHRYWEIVDEKVYLSAKQGSKDFVDFIRYVNDFLETRRNERG